MQAVIYLKNQSFLMLFINNCNLYNIKEDTKPHQCNQTASLRKLNFLTKWSPHLELIYDLFKLSFFFPSQVCSLSQTGYSACNHILFVVIKKFVTVLTCDFEGFPIGKSVHLNHFALLLFQGLNQEL